MEKIKSEQDHLSEGVYTHMANTPDRLEWYQDMALGMYLYWTVDAQFGMVNAHSVIGGSKDYLTRYFKELPKTFNPKLFDAEWYARLAKSCGFNYVMIPAKNHNGFCMWDTKTTNFNVMNTPFSRDVLQEYADALRVYNLPLGLYFSPDDGWYQWKDGNEITRSRKHCNPEYNPGLLEYDKVQVHELLEKFQPDILCFDGYRNATRSLVEFVWSIQPDVMITRGGLMTPEQEMNDDIQGPFEAHYTIGRQWQYRAGNDENKSGSELIRLLADIRSRGGTLLLAIGGPDANGLLPRDKDNLVRELGLWNFINSEAIQSVRPWHHRREGEIYFTKLKSTDTIYVIDTSVSWDWGVPKTITLQNVRLTNKSKIEILGQSGMVLEYTQQIPETTWSQDESGLHITAIRAQRLYNDKTWPNPVVIKITHAQ